MIGVYRIVRLLGKGAIGAVYEVVHTHLGVHYALKAFTLDHGHVDVIREKFIAEGRVLAGLAIRASCASLTSTSTKQPRRFIS